MVFILPTTTFSKLIFSAGTIEIYHHIPSLNHDYSWQCMDILGLLTILLTNNKEVTTLKRGGRKTPNRI